MLIVHPVAVVRSTGDAVDLMVAAVPASRIPTSPMRLLMTVANGRRTAVLYTQAVPGTAAAQRVSLSSPVRTILFDRVAIAPDVQITTGPISGGYFIEARIPWKTLGIQPGAMPKLRADMGVLFAGEGGRTTVSRRYWSNKATGLVNDVPGETELTPALWGTWVLK